MNSTKIGTFEAIAFIVVIILNQIVLNLPQNLLDECGPSTPLNLILVIAFVFLFLFIMLKLWKPFGNSDILDISEFLGGKVFKTIIGSIFIIYFLMISGTLLRNFTEMLKLVYLEKASICLIVLFFIIACAAANRFGFRSVIRCNLIFVPIVLLNLLIAFFCLFPRFELNRIFPIFGYGINQTFFTGMTNIFAFTGISYLYFLKPFLKKPESFNKISYISIGISAFYLFLSIVTLLFSFADVLTVNDLSSVYVLIRGTDFGRFLQRPDALFILGWILVLMSYISTTVLLVNHIFSKLAKIQDTKPMVYCFSTLCFIFALIPKNMVAIRWLEDTLFRYVTIILVFIISFCILLFAYFKHKKQKSYVQKGVLTSET